MMESKKQLPTALVEKQDLQRQGTINKVLRGIADIQNEGRKASISALVEWTGLSRSTFAKPHIRELLTEYGYASGDDTASHSKRKKAKQNDAIAENDRQIAEPRTKNAELDKECELLRCKLFLVVQKQ